MRLPFRFILPALALWAALGWARDGWAEPPDSRLGLVPVVGGGVAGLTAAQPLPGFIGYTTLGGELFGQLRRWGLFVRFEFLSSGSDGRWTAYSGDAGASYRLFGDSGTPSLFARAGLVYEQWTGQAVGGCSITLFVPNSCVTLGHANTSIAGDVLGVTAGVRLELPLRSFYVAVGAAFVPGVTVGTSLSPAAPVTALQPGDVFQLRFDLAVGLRDTRGEHKALHDPNDHHMSY